jgi:hypothetical protein
MKKIGCTPISSPKNKQQRKNNPKTLRLKSTTKIAYLEVADKVQWGMQYCEASHERVRKTLTDKMARFFTLGWNAKREE